MATLWWGKKKVKTGCTWTATLEVMQNFMSILLIHSTDKMSLCIAGHIGTMINNT
jgi:hypothetical protein